MCRPTHTRTAGRGPGPLNNHAPVFTAASRTALDALPPLESESACRASAPSSWFSRDAAMPPALRLRSQAFPILRPDPLGTSSPNHLFGSPAVGSVLRSVDTLRLHPLSYPNGKHGVAHRLGPANSRQQIVVAGPSRVRGNVSMDPQRSARHVREGEPLRLCE